MNILAFLEDVFRADDVHDIRVAEDKPLRVKRNDGWHIVPGTVTSRPDIDELLKALASEIDLKGPVEQALGKRGDKDFGATIGDYRARGNIFFAGGRKLHLVIRKFGRIIPDFASLRLPSTIVSLLNQSKGLILVTGATGSGKSTTLASGVDLINKTRPAHIITLEDPVEYIFNEEQATITQRQVGKDGGSFAEVLRSALRQAPDVIMIGELRDAETVHTALQAANTGHLVLATLHTSSARQTIERLNSFFPIAERDWANQVLSAVLLGVLSQVLIPSLNGQGRQLCYELLVNTTPARENIKAGKTQALFNVMDQGSRDGQVLLNKNLLEKARQGLISVDDARFFAYDVTGFDSELQNAY